VHKTRGYVVLFPEYYSQHTVCASCSSRYAKNYARTPKLSS
jgi:hypothetical protein